MLAYFSYICVILHNLKKIQETYLNKKSSHLTKCTQENMGEENKAWCTGGNTSQLFVGVCVCARVFFLSHLNPQFLLVIYWPPRCA